MARTVEKLEALARVKFLQARLAAYRALARGRLQSAAFGLAGIAVVFLALAAFWALSEEIGRIGAAALVGSGALLAALLCLWFAGRDRPDPEAERLAQMEQRVRESLEGDFARVEQLLGRVERGAAGGGALAEALGLALSLIAAISPKSRVVVDLLRAGLSRFGK